MKYLLIGLIVLIVIVVLAKKSVKTPESKFDLKARDLMTKREQTMYLSLVDALPEFLIFTQVAFSALITSKNQTVRNKFNRKVTDFVICDKQFEVIAIVELDDSTHKGKENADAKRDDFLTSVKYKVVRFPKVASKELIREKIIMKPAQEN